MPAGVALLRKRIAQTALLQQPRQQQEVSDNEDGGKDDDDFTEAEIEDREGNEEAGGEAGDDDGISNSSTKSYNANTSIATVVESVRVVVRARPLLPKEKIAESESCLDFPENGESKRKNIDSISSDGRDDTMSLSQFSSTSPSLSSSTSIPSAISAMSSTTSSSPSSPFSPYTNTEVILGRKKRFSFDHAFSPSVSQDTIYTTCVAPLLDGCFMGYNATVFAYGQTGSGTESQYRLLQEKTHSSNLAYIFIPFLPCLTL